MNYIRAGCFPLLQATAKEPAIPSISNSSLAEMKETFLFSEINYLLKTIIGLLNNESKTTLVGFSLASEDTLGRVMSSPVTTMDAKGTLGVAAQLMIQQDIGSVVVIEGKNPIGIITERDITKQVIKGNDVLKKPIKQVMSKPLVTATPNMPVQDAFELMLKNRIRRLPILEGNDMKGIVTTQDIMRWVLRVSYEPNIPRHIKAILEAR